MSIGEVERLAESIINEYKRNKKRNVDKRVVNNFMNRLENLIESEGLTDDVVKSFVKSNGCAEAIAITITFNRTQLRKLFHQIRRIKMDVKREGDISKVRVKLAKVHAILAYARGRKLIDEYFYRLMNTMINKVRESKSENTFKNTFENFRDIFESIVAYHVYHNPKEG